MDTFGRCYKINFAHAQKDVIEDLIAVAYKDHLNVYFKGYTGY